MSHTFFFMSNPACDYVTERGVKVSVPAQLWLVSTWCWKQIWKVSFSNFSLTIVDLFFFPQICSVILLIVSKSVKVLIQSASTLLQVIRTTFHWCSSIKPTTESEDHQSQLGLIIRELWIFHSDPHQRSVDHRTKSWHKVDKEPGSCSLHSQGVAVIYLTSKGLWDEKKCFYKYIWAENFNSAFLYIWMKSSKPSYRNCCICLCKCVRQLAVVVLTRFSWCLL